MEAVVVRADKLRMEVDFVPYVEDELAKYSQQYPNAKIKGLKKNNKISKKKKKNKLRRYQIGYSSYNYRRIKYKKISNRKYHRTS